MFGFNILGNNSQNLKLTSISHTKQYPSFLREKQRDNRQGRTAWQGKQLEPTAVACTTVMALFGSHLQLTVTLQYQLPFLLIFTTGYFLCTGGRTAHSQIQTTIYHRKRRDPSTFLPFESFAVSPPLYSWGAPMKMPPTFCHMGNKSASFILIFIILSAALYLVTQFVRYQGTGVPTAPSLCHQGRKTRKHWISRN